MAGLIKAWSFSRWQDYEKCPALAKYKHVDRLREPDNPAMENGTIVHRLAEQVTRGDLRKFPKELTNFQPGFKELRENKAATEQEWAFNREWLPTGWFAKDTWLRIKVDAHYLLTEAVNKLKRMTTVVIVDHKTGREKQEHAQQRSLYAVGGFLMYPDAQQVVARHWYIDHAKNGGQPEAQEVYQAKQLPMLQTQWEQRTRAMLSDTRFAPRPGSYCQWCHFRKDNGGPCKF